MIRTYRFHFTILIALLAALIGFLAFGREGFNTHHYMECENQSSAWNQTEKVKGIALAAPPEPIGSWAAEPMKELGAEWVCIMPYGFIREQGSKVIYNHPFQWWGEQRPGVITSIVVAKEQGLKVCIKPHLWTQGVYTGAYHPPKGESWKEFEGTYSDFILDYARISDSLGVDLFCLGSELSTATKKESEFWSSLICHVREEYTGMLSYAANWDNYQNIPFWKELDVIGVNAYFPLDTSSTPSTESVKKSWESWSDQLEAFSVKHNKPILFTELGYRSMNEGLARPWDAAHHGDFNEKIQAIAFTGFFDGIWNEDWLAGAFVWKWHAEHRKAGGPGNTRYTPQNKLAQEIITQHYTHD
jgi:hypothetical protein